MLHKFTDCSGLICQSFNPHIEVFSIVTESYLPIVSSGKVSILILRCLALLQISAVLPYVQDIGFNPHIEVFSIVTFKGKPESESGKVSILILRCLALLRHVRKASAKIPAVSILILRCLSLLLWLPAGLSFFSGFQSSY